MRQGPTVSALPLFGWGEAAIVKGRPQAIAGANSKLLGTSRRSDGRIQVTYAGHPLYYFVEDTKAGQTNGEGLTDFGGRWDPVSAAGKAR